jgi:hypothetical protein
MSDIIKSLRCIIIHIMYTTKPVLMTVSTSVSIYQLHFFNTVPGKILFITADLCPLPIDPLRFSTKSNEG